MYPTVNFSESEQGLFSPGEIQHLMGIEYERAVRYEYPVALLLIEVDRLEYLHDLYGYDSKEEILQAVITLLRNMTRASDLLGCMRDDRIMAVLPHTTKEGMLSLGARLLRGCRELEFASNGRTLRATLSIGLSISERGQEPDFAGFVARAEEAVGQALAAGGDRCTIRETAEEFFEELRQELQDEEERLEQEVQRVQALEDTLPQIEDLPETPLGDRIRELFRNLDREELEAGRGRAFRAGGGGRPPG